MDDIDISRAAKLLLDKHGNFAEGVPRDRRIALASWADGEGFKVWGLIFLVIGELRDKERPADSGIQ